MISRVAEQCYWLGRYLERTENTARVLDVNRTLLLDFEVPHELQWKPLLIISGIHDFAGPFDGEAVQEHLTWEPANPSSVRSSLGYARENARIIRETLSAELWERMNFYYLWMQGPAAREQYRADRNAFFEQVKRINQLLFGIAEATMPRDGAWDFFRVGRILERACQTARILDVKYHLLLPTPQHVGTEIDQAHWVAILKSCSGLEAFHRRRQGPGVGTAVADFLIFDAAFPRSVRYCLEQARTCVRRIVTRDTLPGESDAEKALQALLARMLGTSIEEVVAVGLHEMLTEIVNRIHGIGDAMHRTFFDLPPDVARAAGATGQVQRQE